MKIYVELPDEEKDDIKLNFVKCKVEVKAKRFYKMIECRQGTLASKKYHRNTRTMY